MDRPQPLDAARALVADRYPGARQAWLSGSVVTGRATPTSDLDIVVLQDGVEVHRESLTYDGWPVELFVHTEVSVRHFVAMDVDRRSPSMARLVAGGVPLVAGGGGDDVRAECAAVLAAGPPPLSDVDLEYARYMLTDALDDLAGGAPAGQLDAIAVEVWRRTAELLLASAGCWAGTGKWLIREVEALDADRETHFAGWLHEGLQNAIAGAPTALTEAADEVLDRVGGRMWSGYYQTASLPAGRAAPD